MAADTWQLLCLECRTTLLLGQLATLDEQAEPIPWQFAGFRQIPSGRWVRGSDLWAPVQQFLMIHRGHLLSVVPTYFLDQVDEDVEHIEQDPLEVEELLAIESNYEMEEPVPHVTPWVEREVRRSINTR